MGLNLLFRFHFLFSYFLALKETQSPAVFLNCKIFAQNYDLADANYSYLVVFWCIIVHYCQSHQSLVRADNKLGIWDSRHRERVITGHGEQSHVATCSTLLWLLHCEPFLNEHVLCLKMMWFNIYSSCFFFVVDKLIFTKQNLLHLDIIVI